MTACMSLVQIGKSQRCWWISQVQLSFMKFTCFHCKSDVLLFLESVLLKEQPETYQTGLCSIYSKRSLLLKLPAGGMWNWSLYPSQMWNWEQGCQLWTFTSKAGAIWSLGRNVEQGPCSESHQYEQAQRGICQRSNHLCSQNITKQ